MHFDEEMGFQFLGPRSTVLSPSDLRPPTVRDTIIVLAGGRHCCIGLGGVGFAPSNEDLAFRDGVCHLMNLFLRTMSKLRQGPVQFLGLFLATEQEEFFLKRPRFWNHFGSFFWAGNSTRERLFTICSITLQCKLGQKKCILWLSADETSLSSQSGR